MPSSRTPALFDALDPLPRLLMGPGPVGVYPPVLHAMATPMLGQFDPQFTAYMDEVMVLYRQVFRTDNQWTLLVDGTARAGIEACLASLITPGDTVLVPVFGRFGHLLMEIAARCDARVESIETEWGSVFEPDQIADAVRRHRPMAAQVKNGHHSMRVRECSTASRVRSLREPLRALDPVCASRLLLVRGCRSR